MTPESKGVLTPSKKEKLFGLLKNPNLNLTDIEKKFNEFFTLSDYELVSNYIASFSKEVVVAAEGVPLIGLFFLLYIMMRNGSSSAKCVFYSVLVNLERALKKDIFDAKKKGLLSKESEENKKSLEAIRADVYRVHSCAKVFAFNLLTKNVVMEETVLNIISKKQDYFDSHIEKFVQNPSVLEANINNVFECWKADVESDNCFSLTDSAAVLSNSNKELAVLSFPSVKVKLPSAPVLPGELQFLLPSSQDSSFLFDYKV